MFPSELCAQALLLVTRTHRLVLLPYFTTVADLGSLAFCAQPLFGDGPVTRSHYNYG